MDILNIPVNKSVKIINISHFKMVMRDLHNVSVRMILRLQLDTGQLHVVNMEVIGVIISIRILYIKHRQFNLHNKLNQLNQIQD